MAFSQGKADPLLEEQVCQTEESRKPLPGTKEEEGETLEEEDWGNTPERVSGTYWADYSPEENPQ